MDGYKLEVSQRIKRAQEAIQQTDIDILFIVGRENLIYFTGSTQMECMALLIPREGEATAVTLWLDVGYLKENSAVPNIQGYFFPAQDLVGQCVQIIKDYGFQQPKIGFEKYFVEFKVYEGLRNNFTESDFVNASDLIYRLRSIKTSREVEMIARASEMVSKGMEAAVNAANPGVSELEVLAEAEYAMLKAGSGGSSFRMQVTSGERSLLTHPCASKKKLAPGEIVVIHLGATYEGYCSKMCRTVALGAVPQEQVKAFQLLKEAQDAAVAALKPGVLSWQVDEAARKLIAEAGYENNYLDLVGYGVGLRQSEFYPIIGKNRQDVIEAGMVVDVLLPTIYRKGVGGPRITDVIHVSEQGPSFLTKYPRDLIVK
ncbi:MAG: Xaa-Pro peptidase family protein [Desulfitobacterium hafniense]|nr:Xaa-Pro peptidase family protein [Desulfitobacterium hafniense]